MPVLRPDSTLLWMPDQIADAMQLQRGQRLTAGQYADRDLQALIFSRQKANETGRHCNQEWHERNGYR